MPAKSNIDMLNKISDSLENSNGVFVIDYRGLTVKETQELRHELREVNSTMKVYKNNIVKIALERAGMPDISDKLTGTCAYVFFEGDPVDAAKAIKKESEKLKKIEWVAGIADNKGLSAEEAKAYADLASREELIAQFVYVAAAPLRGIASVCAGPARGFVTVVDKIREQKEAA